jgi:type II secretory pathway predicted ATPase ExeA
MYEAYWSLAKKPFGGGCDTSLYYPSDAHQGALLKLRYAVESRHGAALLTGHAGVGKSLVSRMLLERSALVGDTVVLLTFPQMPAANLLAYLAHELKAPGQTIGREPPIDESVRIVSERLLENARAGKHAVIVVDEAHLLEGPRTFDALRLLLNVEHEGRAAVTLVFVGQPALLPIVDRMPQLEQRLAVKCLIRPLTLDETHAYVQHRLAAAGCEQALFDSAAIETLHAVAQGNPRDLNRLCDLSLLIGFADSAETITPERVEAVARELVQVSSD